MAVNPDGLRACPFSVRFARSLTWFLALALAGCATLPPPSPLPSAARLETPLQIKSFHLSGRIGTKYQGEGFYGNLRWRHSPSADEIFILSPLGQGVAQIVQDASGVTLTTSEPRVYHAEDAEDLTMEVLGWRLPLAGLRYWVLGLAAPGSAAAVSRDASGRPARLVQDAWQIDYQGFEAVRGVSLPRKIEMRRGELEIKLVVDRWDIADR